MIYKYAINIISFNGSNLACIEKLIEHRFNRLQVDFEVIYDTLRKVKIKF